MGPERLAYARAAESTAVPPASGRPPWAGAVLVQYPPRAAGLAAGVAMGLPGRYHQAPGAASGHDVIGDFVDGEDLIHFVTTGLGVYAITADGDDAVLQLDSNGANTIRIENFDVADLDNTDWLHPILITHGGNGDDTFHGSELDDDLTGGGGHDVFYGGAGDDRLAGDDRPIPPEVASLLPPQPPDYVWGDDTLSGGAGYDTLYGYKGDDTLYGGEDTDGLHGGEGNDRLVGGEGQDGLYGDDGNDTLIGGHGRDWLEEARAGSSCPGSSWFSFGSGWFALAQP